MPNAEKYRDDILKLVDTSKASCKTCIDSNKIINTDKDGIDEETIKVPDNNDSIDEKITEETMKVMDNNDSIDEKIVENKKENRLVIIEDSNKDTKPNINKDTKPNIEINEKTMILNTSMIGKKEQ